MILLEPVAFSDFELENRVFMAPLTRNRAENPEAKPTQLHVEYYRQRAQAGLIVTEATVVSPQGVGYVHVPGIYSAAQVRAWKEVTSSVHREGGHIFCQLWHVGRITHPWFLNGATPVAPSAVNPGIRVSTPEGIKESVTPHALSQEEIASIVVDFRQAAANAWAAGFDGVEIHASNGYLIHQFFNNCSNLRTDAYGGTHENKARFLKEILDAVKTVIPEQRIGVRLNPMMHQSSGIEVDSETRHTFDYVVGMLNQYRLAYLHLTRPWQKREGSEFIQDVIGHYRTLYKGFLVANGNYGKESGEAEVMAGRADAIAFGRPFIANPDLPVRFERGLELNEADKTTYYSGGEKGYTDYPLVG